MPNLARTPPGGTQETDANTAAETATATTTRQTDADTSRTSARSHTSTRSSSASSITRALQRGLNSMESGFRAFSATNVGSGVSMANIRLASCGINNDERSLLSEGRRKAQQLTRQALQLAANPIGRENEILLTVDAINNLVGEMRPQLEQLFHKLQSQNKMGAVNTVASYWGEAFHPMEDALHRLRRTRPSYAPGSLNASAPPTVPATQQAQATASQPPPEASQHTAADDTTDADNQSAHSGASAAGGAVPPPQASPNHESTTNNNASTAQAHQPPAPTMTTAGVTDADAILTATSSPIPPRRVTIQATGGASPSRRGEKPLSPGIQIAHPDDDVVLASSDDAIPARRGRNGRPVSNTQRYRNKKDTDTQRALETKDRQIEQLQQQVQQLLQHRYNSDSQNSPPAFQSRDSRPLHPRQRQQYEEQAAAITRSHLPQGYNPSVPPPNTQNTILAKYAAYIRPTQPATHHPFQTHIENEVAYYIQLPHPWNIVPDTNSAMITDFKKLDGLAGKFDGRTDSYAPWRACFIPTVHQANAPIAWKAASLMRALNPDSPRLRDIIAGLDATPAGYTKAISRLEKAFGHPLGTLGMRMRALEQIEYVRRSDLRTIEKLHLKLEDYLQELETLARTQDMTASKLYEDIFRKLDSQLGQEFLQWNTHHGDFRNPTAIHLLAWLEEKVDQLRTAARIRRPDRDAGFRHTNNVREFQAAHFTNPSSNNCPLDNLPHKLVNCDKFKALSITQRRARMKEWNRCYACLDNGHKVAECQRGIVCDKCQRKHHTLLHRDRQQPTHRQFLTTEGTEEDEWSEDDPEFDDAEQDADTLNYHTNHRQPQKISLHTLPIRCRNPRGSAVAWLNCMMDSGSTGHFMSKRAAKRLGVSGHVVFTTIKGFNGITKTIPVMIARLTIVTEGKNYTITVQITDDPAASYLPFDWTQKQQDFDHLRDLPLQPPVPNQPVDVMLGQNTPHLIKALEPDRGGEDDNQPVARRTVLGWTVGGPTHTHTNSADAAAYYILKARSTWPSPATATAAEHWQNKNFGQPSHKTHTKKQQNDNHKELEQAVRELIDLDHAMGPQPLTREDRKIIQILSTSRGKQGSRHVYPVLFKQFPPNIPNNYHQAISRLISHERSKAMSNSTIREQYLAQLQDWLKNDFVEEVTTTTPKTDRAFYLPHFAVIRMDKTSSQIRTVMDGAAKTKGGTCLNDFIYKGPKLINNLVEVLLRFRHKPVTITCDISKMFLKLYMPEEHRDYHRFLWRDNNDREPKIYRWKSHVFGNSGSPCVAIFAVKNHAKNNQKKFPQAADTIMHATLVDDSLDSTNTAEEAVTLLGQLRQLLASMDMDIKKVTSNSREVVASIPETERSQSLNISSFHTHETSLPLVKTLGVIYLAEEDAFSFQLQQFKNHTRWTKRLLLQMEARLYDPHGLILPVTIHARAIFQESWRATLDWDDPLPEHITSKWQEWLQHLQHLPKLRIPRCIADTQLGPAKNTTFTIFTDASQVAYAAVAYAVTEHVNGDASSTLVVAKGRVAPLKQLSIPRLELLAAELAVDITHTLTTTFKTTLQDIHYRTDSVNVLCWIKHDSRALNTFTGTRVAKIQTHTLPDNWAHTTSETNPADVASRGENVGPLALNGQWWKGPDYLVQPHLTPPQPQQLVPTEDARKEIKHNSPAYQFHQVVTTRDQVHDGYDPTEEEFRPVLDTSSWQHLVRLVAWCRRVLSKTKPQHLTPQELRDSQNTILRMTQKASFKRTLADIANTQQVGRKSSTYKLQPRLFADGLLRLESRLQYDHTLQYDIRFPILLPADHPVTTMIIRDQHAALLHAGKEHTLNHLRNRFWIINGRRTVQKILTKCIICRRANPVKQGQKMAPLPIARTTMAPPFTCTGADLAGPYFIKSQFSHKEFKRYFLLLTCLTTRAVHLEPLQSASATSLLLALDRFVSRRLGGEHPKEIHCDNAANFVRAEKELKSLWKEDSVQVKYPLTTFQYIPPTGSHFGGVYERMIKSVKQRMYHILPHSDRPTEEEFHSALVFVEGILNSRPLVRPGDGAGQKLSLTPADALGVPPFRQPAHAPPQGPASVTKRWHVHQQRLDTFWKHFRQDYVQNLQQAQKWHVQQTNLKKGDVVLLLEDQARGKWPLARVEHVEEGADGLVRIVHVRLGEPRTRLLRRPVHGLARLFPAEDRSEVA